MSGVVPDLRFPEFQKNHDCGLRSIQFSDLFSFHSGKNIKQGEASPNFEIPCVRYGELYHLYGEVISATVNNTNLPKSELKFSDGDEILLPSAGEDPMDIGSASALTLKNVAIGRTINILKPLNESDYDPVYVSFYINSVLRKRIFCLARGASISNVYNSDLKTLTINLPSLLEQRKIAAFLGSVDAKLTGLREKADALRQFKTGLMQKLFSQELRFTREDGSDFPDWEERDLGDLFRWVRTNSLSREHLTDDDGSGIQNIHYGDIHTKYRAIFRQTYEEVPFVTSTAPLRTISDEDYVRPGDVVIADASEDYGDGGVSKSCWFALCSYAPVRYAEASEARGDPPCPASIRPNSAACLPA